MNNLIYYLIPIILILWCGIGFLIIKKNISDEWMNSIRSAKVYRKLYRIRLS